MEILEFLIIQQIIDEIEKDLLYYFRVISEVTEVRTFFIAECKATYKIAWWRTNDNLRVRYWSREHQYDMSELTLSLSECIETIVGRS